MAAVFIYFLKNIYITTLHTKWEQFIQGRVIVAQTVHVTTNY